MRCAVPPWPGSVGLRPYAEGVDKTDRGIIELLRQNSRANYADIGAVVGLSASAVKRRVDRLVADEVIRGFTIDVDPGLDGLHTEAYVEVFCRGPISSLELRRLFTSIPEIIEAGTVAGSADAIIRVRTRDVAALDAVLERLRLSPRVESTRSTVVLGRLIGDA